MHRMLYVGGDTSDEVSVENFREVLYDFATKYDVNEVCILFLFNY